MESNHNSDLLARLVAGEPLSDDELVQLYELLEHDPIARNEWLENERVDAALWAMGHRNQDDDALIQATLDRLNSLPAPPAPPALGHADPLPTKEAVSVPARAPRRGSQRVHAPRRKSREWLGTLTTSVSAQTIQVQNNQQGGSSTTRTFSSGGSSSGGTSSGSAFGGGNAMAGGGGMAGGNAFGNAGGNAGGFGGNGPFNGIDLGNLLQNPGLMQGGFPNGMQQNNSSSHSVSVSENGKTISITQNNENGITVTVTEMVDGEESKTIVKAATPQELKAKNEEAYKLYERYLLKQDQELQLLIQQMLQNANR